MNHQAGGVALAIAKAVGGETMKEESDAWYSHLETLKPVNIVQRNLLHRTDLITNIKGNVQRF